MAHTPQELRDRTKAMAIRIIPLFRALPSAKEAQIMGTQLLRCGTSVAANYRAACRGRSRAEFTAKLGIVNEEADETVFWLELMIDTAVLPPRRMKPLLNEAHELAAIFTAAHRTARGK